MKNRRLTSGYLAALLLLVLADLVIFVGAGQVMERYSSSPAQVIAGTHLETTAQSLDGDLRELTVSKRPDAAPFWRRRVLMDLAEINRTYGGLMGTKPLAALHALRPELREELAELRPYIVQMKQAMNTLAKLPASQLALLRPTDPQLNDAWEATESFLDRVDGAVQRIAEDAQHRAVLREGIDVLFLALNLGALVLIGLLVIQPMTEDLQRQSDNLAAANAELNARVREQEEARQAVQESHELLRSITDSAQDPIVIMDARGCISFWNEAAQTVFGYPMGVALGMPFERLFLRDEAGTRLTEALRALAGGPTPPFPGGLLALVARRQNGEHFQCELSLSAVHVKGVWNAVAIARDVSERRRAGEQLLRLGTAVEQSAESVIITDPDGVIQYVNPAFEKLTGYTRAEAQGHTPSLVRSGRQDGVFYQDLWRTILSGSTWSGHLVNRRKDGTLFEEEATISPVRDGEGRIMSFIAVKRDVTESMQLEAQLRQSQKLEAIGTLVGGIAHDFNNVLTPILGFAELAGARVAPDSREHEYLDRICASAKRARDLIAQILLFSRKGEARRKPLMLSPVVKETVKLLNSSLPANVRIHLDISRQLPNVLADGTQIYTLLMNLCINAAHAMPEGGELHVSLAEMRLTNLIGHDGEQVSGRYVRLQVRDTGIGMDEATQARIFEPFFTTKEAGKGTGLGLSTVYGIVKQHQGVIRVYSRPGEGSIFDVYLPAKTAVPAVEQPALTSAPVSGITALVVDDEEAITCLAANLLESWGCRVTTVNGSDAALAAFQEGQAAFDVVLSDQIMPGMTGDRLVETLRRTRPDLPAVIMTGKDDTLPQSEPTRSQQTAVLRKPFSQRELGRTLVQVLGLEIPPGTRPS